MSKQNLQVKVGRDMLWLSQKLFELLVLLLPIQLGRHFWPDFAYIQGLRVDYLSPTIYLTDILVILILLFWFFEKKKKIKFKNLFFIFSIFIFLLINSLLAKNSGAALYKFFKILEFSLLGFYVAKNKINLSIIHFPLSIAVIYSSIIAIAQFLKQSSLNGIFWFLGERTFNAGTPGIAKTVIAGRLLMRPYATFSHPNALAGFLLVGLILTLPLFKKSKLFVTCYLLLVTCVLALTFSRSVWLVGALIAGWYLFKNKKFLLITNYSLLITFLFFSFRFSTDESFFQRLDLAKAAAQMFRLYPLSGVGLNNFVVYLPEFWQPKNQILWLQPVHNIFLLVTAETGLVGLVIFLWFLILTFKKLLITNYYLLITALSAILALGLFDHYWLTLQQNQLLLAIVLGFCWAQPKKGARMVS